MAHQDTATEKRLREISLSDRIEKAIAGINEDSMPGILYKVFAFGKLDKHNKGTSRKRS